MATKARSQAKASTAPPKRLPGQVVLVLQGGGALGAYQVGVYQAMHEAGVEPDWIIGTSIGAINGAIIAGNRVEDRFARLAAFWKGLERERHAALPWWPPAGNPLANLATLTHGIPGFFAPNPQALWGLQAQMGAESAAFYVAAPLRDTLLDLIDFDLLNSGKVRLSLGAVGVADGEMRYFDSREENIELEHVMASGALPPAFPAVRIDGELYWDGGIYSNTPVEAVLDERPRRDSLIFAVNVWNAAGPEPETILQVMGRHKEIQYASRAKSHLERQSQIHRLRHVVRELASRLPESMKDDPEVAKLASYGCATRMHLVRLVAPRVQGEDLNKDIDFTSAGISARWDAGYAAARRMLEREPWQQSGGFLDGIVVHEED
ncbi:MAG: patatin-like phospholipase family protein [Betaproteobacteria bacterium]|nr:patatin-like phospholipase family protein [Betaproteobacteria bacterium]